MIRLNPPQNPMVPHRVLGMPPGEERIWLTALEVLRSRWRAVHYRTLVGGRAQFSAGMDSSLTRMAEDLSALKIDAVGDAGDHWDIVEVKDRSSLSAIGQLMAYKVLWDADPPDPRETRMIYVSPQITPEAAQVMTHFGIEQVIVPLV